MTIPSHILTLRMNSSTLTMEGQVFKHKICQNMEKSWASWVQYTVQPQHWNLAIIFMLKWNIILGNLGFWHSVPLCGVYFDVYYPPKYYCRQSAPKLVLFVNIWHQFRPIQILLSQNETSLLATLCHFTVPTDSLNVTSSSQRNSPEATSYNCVPRNVQCKLTICLDLSWAGFS